MATPALSTGHIASLARSFRRSLLSENKAPRTVKTYCDAVRLLADFLERTGCQHASMRSGASTSSRSSPTCSVVADLLRRNKLATDSNRYRGAARGLSLLAEEGGDPEINA